jgi:hypothetical protein
VSVVTKGPGRHPSHEHDQRVRHVRHEPSFTVTARHQNQVLVVKEQNIPADLFSDSTP